MPPRFIIQPSLKAFTGSSHVQTPFAALALNPSKTIVRAGSAETRERKRHDPFAMAQTRQRKAANLSRQQALEAERDASLGDPIETEPTPFIQQIKSQLELQGTTGAEAKPNHFIKPEEIQETMEFSKDLTSPIADVNRNIADPQLEKEAMKGHAEEAQNTEEAIRRIVNLNNGNTKDRLRVNIQNCIETFGRHNTDTTLPPKPTAVSNQSGTERPEKTPRVGPDTGSPEVQVAVLTTKILNLSRHLQTSNKDKHNKRNLRLLVHKRQKLLRYLRRKERGGPRWQNLMQTLGLTDAAWKGEISM
ncbi:mitochondrial 37S ribosomal protein uS15m [Aspergillus chevalieri]|uniref:Ribosomal protein S15 n=1 Tax=Aspergillus chevalieri TaxID=182096 RepID=A0A7R7VJ34_ASPCH|nr:uncharacterized protein ACHE_20187S [Aspergillus chevalieri]BCR84729.1 hypothetical protein ACHE_20187S [Aspergillus chevalieri]